MNKSFIKGLVAILMLMLVDVTANAQYYMNVIKTDGTTIDLPVDEIDNVSFSYHTPELKVATMEAVRLPDLNIARGDQVVFVSNGQLVVAGGHVEDFDVTYTAEYFDNREWHTINMNYSHDMAFSVVFSDGRMMIGGGCPDGWGIGQSSAVEMYYPENHSFAAIPSMTSERALTRAVELADGNVFVSGNWYNYDSRELYSASANEFSSIGSVSEARSLPYILRSDENNAIIFGPMGNYGGSTSLIVDRYEGDPFEVELLETWTPFALPVNWRAADCAIGDYSYLIAAKRYDENYNQEIGLIKVVGETFSLLDLELPIPAEYEGVTLNYSGTVFTDKDKKVAYMPAWNGNINAPVYFILKIDYSASKGKLTLYKTDVLDAYASITSMTMLPDGRLVAVGGVYDSNFHPYSTVWAFKPF